MRVNLNVLSRLGIVFLSIGLLIFSDGSTVVAQRAISQGYFSGYSYPDGDYYNTLPLIDSGLNYSNITDKASFLNFIQGTYGDGDFMKHEDSDRVSGNKVGAAFIIQSMRGGDDYAKPDASDINDWRNRVNSGSVSLSVESFAYSINSGIAYRSVNNSIGRPLNDAVQYSWGDNQPSLVFRDNGVIKFAIKISCANPVGNLQGLTLGSWSLSATSTANMTNAKPGDTIVWYHTLSNNGPSPTNWSVHSNLGITNISIWSNPNVEYSAKDTPAGATGTMRSNSDFPYNVYTVQASDVGKRLCEQVRFTPVDSNISGHGSSIPACVDISEPPMQTSICRPIKFIVEPKTYGPVSHRDPWGRTHSNSNGLVPVNVSIEGSTIGNSPYSTKTTIENNTSNFVTRRYTDGLTHTVTFSDSRTHVYGYHDVWVDDYTKPIYYYVPVYKTVATTNKKTGVTTYTQVYVRTDKYFSGSYQQKYSGTTYPLTTSSTWYTSIGPCYDYKLNITGTNSFGFMVEPGTSTTISPTVSSTPFTSTLNPATFWNKYQTHSRSKQTRWYKTMFVVTPKKNVTISQTIGGNNTTDPCSYFKNSFKVGASTAPSSIVSCTSTMQTTVFEYPGISTPSSTFTPTDVEAGTKYCFAFSLYPNKSDPVPYNESNAYSPSSEYNHGSFDPVNNCITVVKKPKTQIIGGDLLAGRQMGSTANLTSNVNTSTSVKSGTTYGSWIEYGILATGKINGAASDSAYANPATASSCAKLSFSNNGNTACNYNNISSSPLGQYFTNRSIPSVANSFPIVAATPTTPATPMLSGSITLDNYVNPSSTSQTYGATSDLTINAASSNSTTVAKGKWIVINATGHKVTINSNIRYTSERLYNSKDIPQVVIIADQIDITDNASGPNKVTNLDAWLIATNSINTCSSVPMGTGSGTNLSSQVCNDKLTVNGPVMTNKLYLRRTAGSGTGAINSGDPAEVFNLRADAYMWSYERAKKSSVIKSVYTVELAPRF